MAKHIVETVDELGLTSLSGLLGKTIGVPGIYSRNITKELLSIKDHLQTILGKISDGVLEITSEGRIVYANSVALSIIEIPEERLLGFHFIDLFADDDRHRVAELMKPSGDKPQITTEEFSLLLNGHQVTLQFSPIDGYAATSLVIINDITERKQTEEVLKKSEEKFRTLFDTSPHAIALTEMKTGKIVDVNDKFCQLTEYKKDEVIGVPTTQLGFYSEDDRNRFVDELTDSGKVHGLEMDFRAKHGSIINAHMFAVPIQFEGEALVLTEFHDVSEQKRTKEALLESEEKFRSLAENQHDVVWTVNENLEVDYISPSCFKMTGTTAEETSGKNPNEFYTEESYQRVIMKLAEERQKSANEMQPGVLEVEQYHEDGHLFPVEITCMPVIIDNKFVGVQGITRDITERKNAEKALRESEEKYKRVVENALIGICQVEKSGGFIMANQRIAEMFGYDSPENLLSSGVNIADLYVDPEERAMIHQELDVKGSLTGKILRLKKKTGEHFWVKYHVRMLRKNGKTIYEGLWEDITKEKTLTENLERAHKMEAIGTLAGGVAHDLNNILGGLVSYPELLLLKLPEDSPLRDMVSTIQKSGEKAAATVQDLLTLARRGLVVTEVITLNDVISEYLESPEHEKLQSYHPGVQIETHLEKYPLHIEGSPIHLSKTVMNLISNAAEAMPEGGTLIVSTENKYLDRAVTCYDNLEEGDYMVLTVSDTGTGISPDDLEKIFEPFYTKKKMGRSGTGLGMAVVWGTVKDHKGYIDVQSSEGKGTTFTLYFPATRKKPSEDETPLSVESYRGNGESILVIDDVEEQRKIASGMLKEIGYSVVSVSSGEEAVEYLKTNKVDLLVLDMIMDPGMDGLDIYKKIIEIHPGQKAIIASGFSETDRVKEVQSLGAGAYIRKPLLLEKLGLAVKKELEK